MKTPNPKTTKSKAKPKRKPKRKKVLNYMDELAKGHAKAIKRYQEAQMGATNELLFSDGTNKPKRKPREWRIIIDENGLIVYPGTLSETLIPRYLQSIKVREVIE